MPKKERKKERRRIIIIIIIIRNRAKTISLVLFGRLNYHTITTMKAPRMRKEKI